MDLSSNSNAKTTSDSVLESNGKTVSDSNLFLKEIDDFYRK